MSLAVCLLIVAGLPLGADDVYLKNGNHLSGAIVSMNEGKLVLETEFAGRLTIDWRHVERLSADAPLTLVLADGSTIREFRHPTKRRGGSGWPQSRPRIPCRSNWPA